MRPQRPSRLHILLIVTPTLLVFSARMAWPQEKPSPAKTPAQLSNFAAQLAATPEAGIRFNPADEKLPLPVAPNQEQTPSQVRFRSPDIGYHLPLTTNNALPELWQLARTDELQAKANHFIGNAPAKWLTDVIPHDTVQYRAPDRDDVVQYYGHRIPWAGRVILSMGEKAKVHPRVARVVEFIKPGLSLDKPSRSRWIGR